MSRRILIVDDDEDVRRILTMRLRRAGFSVGEAENGGRALHELNESEWDLILLDLMMPEVNGFDFLDRVRTLGRGLPPIVVVTQLDDLESRDRAIALGATEYVSKGHALGREFVSSVRAWLAA